MIHENRRMKHVEIVLSLQEGGGRERMIEGGKYKI
jgi:hypothetical protein